MTKGQFTVRSNQVINSRRNYTRHSGWCRMWALCPDAGNEQCSLLDKAQAKWAGKRGYRFQERCMDCLEPWPSDGLEPCFATFPVL